MTVADSKTPPLPSPFAMVGQCARSVVLSKKNKWTSTKVIKEACTCPNCGQFGATATSDYSEDWHGGGSGHMVDCPHCGFCDGDGDGWSSERSCVEPNGFLFNESDALCHKCQDALVFDSILCPQCEDEIYGEAAGEEMRRRRKLPYEPLEGWAELIATPHAEARA